jgi:hypothetical protein
MFNPSDPLLLAKVLTQRRLEEAEKYRLQRQLVEKRRVATMHMLFFVGSLLIRFGRWMEYLAYPSPAVEKDLNQPV